jgi:hypothetical protein
MEELGMAGATIKREILGVFMESPFYFTMPLRERLELLNLFSLKSVYQRLCLSDEHSISEPSSVFLSKGDHTDN